MQKNSLADAFKSIMNKKIADEEAHLDHFAAAQKKEIDVLSEEEKPATAEPVLAKYKKKARDIEASKVKDEKDRRKRALKEKQRLMGRVMPSK